jgi:alanyl-tRNA synthetase
LTERLYYDDAYVVEFDARVVGEQIVHGKPAVFLDRTYFYPTSGGQQFDTGTLNNVPVVDVQVVNGDIAHILGEPLGLGSVHGRIDWDRRFDHMQQHTGQHLLSHVFYRLFRVQTVSVHFGERICTLDLDTPSMTRQQRDNAEHLVNKLLLENREVRTYWVNDEELARLPLRRPAKVQHRIRIVEIQDLDWSACGGTHVKRTGEIGLIKLLKTERTRGRVRVHFIAGLRALGDYCQKERILDELAAMHDTGIEQLPIVITARKNYVKELEQQVQALQNELLTVLADELLGKAKMCGDFRLVCEIVPKLERTQLIKLAQMFQSEPGVVAMLGGFGERQAALVYSRAPDLTIDVSQLLRRSLSRYGGKGGGRPEFAQGATSTGNLQEILSDSVEQLRCRSDPEF